MSHHPENVLNRLTLGEEFLASEVAQSLVLFQSLRHHELEIAKVPRSIDIGADTVESNKHYLTREHVLPTGLGFAYAQGYQADWEINRCFFTYLGRVEKYWVITDTQSLIPLTG
jgi:hypothetical protein